MCVGVCVGGGGGGLGVLENKQQVTKVSSLGKMEEIYVYQTTSNLV